MIEATSCGGVVIFRGKILLLYKNIKNKYEGWVLPKGTVEAGETHEETALREVLEESGSKAYIVDYIGRSEYSFTVRCGGEGSPLVSDGNGQLLQQAPERRVFCGFRLLQIS